MNPWNLKQAVIQTTNAYLMRVMDVNDVHVIGRPVVVVVVIIENDLKKRE